MMKNLLDNSMLTRSKNTASFLWPLAIFKLLLVVMVLVNLLSCGLDDSNAANKEIIKPSSNEFNANKLSNQMITRLLAAGWTQSAAVAVVDLNQTHFNILAEYPARLESHLEKLERLGEYENLSILPTLERYPELAALYSGAQSPIQLERAFVADDCAGIYSGMFQLIIDMDEQNALAEAFQRHETSICALGKQGITAPATIFIFDRDRPGAKEYERWLDEVVSQALRSTHLEDAVTEILAMAINQGEYLRSRLGKDAEFRRQFRARLWPAFVRVTDCSSKPEGECDTPFELIADEPRVWDLLLQDRGEELLKKGGLLAVEFFTDPPEGVVFPSNLRPLAREALLEGNNNTLSALVRFQEEPLFRQLMLREDLDAELRQSILGDLNRVCPDTLPQCPDLEKRMRALGNFSLATLREDLAPEPEGIQTWIPLYSSYYLVKKIAQGRDVSAIDITFATMDVAFIAVDIFTLGSSKTVTQTIKTSSKAVTQTVKQSAKTLAKETAESVAKKTIKRSAKAIGKEVLEQSFKQGRMMAAVTKSYFKKIIRMPSQVNRSVDNAIAFDITKPTQWMFEKTGIGRKSMKKLTGLEARVFMRKDARLIVNPRNGYTGILLSEFIESAGAEEISEMVLNLGTWQRHTSAWWFDNADMVY